MNRCGMNKLSWFGLMLFIGSGTALATHWGFSPIYSGVLIGFGLGIVFFTQGFNNSLSKRIAELEGKLESSTTKS